METYRMWDKTPLLDGEEPVIEYYPAENRKTDCAFVIFPGGGYCFRTPYEGDGYARFLNSHGIDAFVCEYRLCPYRFPVQLLDARRAVRFVRKNADRFGISKNKIVAMGSSAGGHLVSLLANFRGPVAGEGTDETDREDFMPDGTVLCYAVTDCELAPDDKDVYGCLMALCDGKDMEKLYTDRLVGEHTPPAFIWATYEDSIVNCVNSIAYASALAEYGIPHELHILEGTDHGAGLAPENAHVHQWAELMIEWLKTRDFL
ncbi:MAG: alpha/beta hydrolase [Clostridia bacterium]|nr:alpha/beta hydrolase [Clostridia bacterium]